MWRWRTYGTLAIPGWHRKKCMKKLSSIPCSNSAFLFSIYEYEMMVYGQHAGLGGLIYRLGWMEGDPSWEGAITSHCESLAGPLEGGWWLWALHMAQWGLSAGAFDLWIVGSEPLPSACSAPLCLCLQGVSLDILLASASMKCSRSLLVWFRMEWFPHIREQVTGRAFSLQLWGIWEGEISQNCLWRPLNTPGRRRLSSSLKWLR